VFFDADLKRRQHDGEAWSKIAKDIIEPLPKEVYLSIDIDGLDPAHCPHTGTPVPGGFQFAEVTTLLRLLAESGRRIVGFDLVEVAPDPTGATRVDVVTAARLLYQMIGFAFMTRPQTS
jgi:agmatinase